ncbi:hypothetical protein ABVF61_31540 [Roseibium sp. HPY-6]|uniref:ImmA/IrrE family metallo-endopeptidase n=1 Tax=Roseibium sp. HPY-6 TaxID=3229852 RepID=UPI00338E1408
MRFFLICTLFALMGGSLFYAPDGSVRLARQLQYDGRLYEVTSDERSNLEAFLSEMAIVTGSNKSFSINAPYDARHINLYIVETSDVPDTPFPVGNAAYVSHSDIIFIDASYFRFGAERVFADPTDSLTAGVLTPLRVYAYFVLAHEFGHRKLHRSIWPDILVWGDLWHRRELEADDFAIKILSALYSSEDSRRQAGIPEPVSSMIGLLDGEETSLQRLTDHLGYAIAFLSEEVFENAFPLLSRSDTHPAFFGRMSRLLDQLAAEARILDDQEALRQLRVIRSIMSATAALMELKPAEIELEHPFQFAFLDNEHISIVGNDNTGVLTRNLDDLSPGTLIRIENKPPQREATVRYAWPGATGETLVLRREGTLEAIRNSSGAVLSQRTLNGQFGDNSCVKRIILAPAPASFVYVYFCVEGVDHVATLNRNKETAAFNLQELSSDALQDAGLLAARATQPTLRIVGFDLDAAGSPALHVVAENALFLILLSQTFHVQSVHRLDFDPVTLPESMNFRGARITPKTFVTDDAGKSFFLRGSPLFREFDLLDAGDMKAAAWAAVDLTPSIDEPRLAQIVSIRSIHLLGGNRMIVNLVEGGAYLINFNAKMLAPLNRQGFSQMEQVLSNERGDWILYRKYGNRILVFREGDRG